MRRLTTMALLIAILAQPAAAAGPARSAQSWPEATRLALEAREAAIWPVGSSTAEGTGGVVTGTASPVAVHAGAEALRTGGTAADAAVATALTQVATMLGANVSFAGVVELVYFEARTGQIHVMDAGWRSWRGERSPATIPDADISMITGRKAGIQGAAGRKALVPGFMAGMEAMHRRFGRLPFRRLFAPAIWYAENGVPVTPLLAGYFGLARPILETTPEGRAFLPPDRQGAPTMDERFRQPALAATLKAVARQGSRYMYRGAWARHYVDALRARGGAASLDDMAGYAPRWTAPLGIDLAGARLMGPDAANPNGCAILAALNLLEHRGKLRPNWEDATALRVMALAARTASSAPWAPEVTAFEQREGIGGSCAARATPAYGAAAAKMLDMLAPIDAPLPAGHHSASVVAVDRWGNVAALVHSSNTPIWGDTGMIVDGVPVPTPAGIYQSRLAQIAPGDPLPSDMAPMILLRGGKPVTAIATIGTSLVPETVRLLYGIAHGGDPLAWLAAPPMLLNVEDLASPLAKRDELVPAGRYAPALLSAAGLAVREVDAQRALVLRGTAVLARLQPGRNQAFEAAGVMGFAEAE